MVSDAVSGLRVVVLKDDHTDVEQIAQALKSVDPDCDVLHVRDEQGFRAALDDYGPDVVISDHCVGALPSRELLRRTQTRRPLAAFFLVSEAFEAGASETLKCGAADFIRHADLDRLGDALHDTLRRRAPLRTLSQRQLQVLTLLAQGNSTREIAEALGVSAKTVETHRAHLMRRLGIHDVAGLVRFAIGSGLVPPLT